MRLAEVRNEVIHHFAADLLQADSMLFAKLDKDTQFVLVALVTLSSEVMSTFCPTQILVYCIRNRRSTDGRLHASIPFCVELCSNYSIQETMQKYAGFWMISRCIHTQKIANIGIKPLEHTLDA